MRFNSKSLLMLVVVVALLGFAYFAVFSKKSSINNSNNATPTPSSVTVGGEASGSETVKNEIKLEVTSPEDGETVTKSPVLVSGTTVSGADVSVNDAETKADANGEFKVSVPLDEGENEIFVTANDISGNSAESSIKVTLNTE